MATLSTQNLYTWINANEEQSFLYMRLLRMSKLRIWGEDNAQPMLLRIHATGAEGVDTYNDLFSK